MDSFPDEFKFQKTWRRYQACVLDELAHHLNDNKLHIIAPPGSGKTILGLEVVRLLNHPTLILSPTITIRDQWIERLTALFLKQSMPFPSWISTDIYQPEFLTSVTYQALHSACKDMDTSSADRKKKKKEKHTSLFDQLKQRKIQTIVLDEAHHLKNEWWKSLILTIENLESPVIVSVTATPPYDVSYNEWKRYNDICGEVDAEIFVPELVQAGDLCPHQDYIHITTPTSEDYQKLLDFQHNVSRFKEKFYSDQDFIADLKKHPWIQEPELYMENILEETAYFSSIAVFLNHIGQTVPENFISILGGDEKDLPAASDLWLEILLTGCFFKDETFYLLHKDRFKELKRELSRIGAVDHKKVFLQHSPENSKRLVSSTQKLNSILDIVNLEIASLGQSLRLVILTDFVRKSEMPGDSSDIKPLNHIGVVPIFETIRQNNIQACRLGILSGSVMIIPESAAETLHRLNAESQGDHLNITLTPLKHDSRYFMIEAHSSGRSGLVHLVTQLLALGEINVLVGTKSLLGEGWDAPSINALILATFVGSYVTSNQMRGRAIRSEPGNPSKTANIWHLVCEQPDKQVYSHDFKTLHRRLKGFVGVSFSEPVIENGINRLEPGKPPYTKDSIEKLNHRTFKKAVAREDLISNWKQALKSEKGQIHFVEEIRTPVESVGFLKNILVSNFKIELLTQFIYLGAGILFLFSALMTSFGSDMRIRTLMLVAAVSVLLLSMKTWPNFFRASILYFRHGNPARSIRQMGNALLRTLIYAGYIKTPLSKLKIKTEIHKDGSTRCFLSGCNTYERSVFLTALRELIDPIDNPRYILTREATWKGDFYDKYKQQSRVGKRRFSEKVRKKMGEDIKTVDNVSDSWLHSLHVDYHAVPQILGRKKSNAVHFERMWRRYMGDGELVYTRTQSGRQTLLKARLKSLSGLFQEKTQRMSRWV